MFRISFWSSLCMIFYCSPVLNLAKIIGLRNAGKIHFESAWLMSSGNPQSFIRLALFPFHPQNITCLFVIYFENEIHLFWQMLVLGQWPKLSLIFWTATQDLWFILCCQTNKIVHLSHCRIIIFLEGLQCWNCSVWSWTMMWRSVGWSINLKHSSLF